LPHVGCTLWAHRRKSVDAEAHEGNIDVASAQCDAQVGSGVVPGQLRFAILSHVEVHEPSTCDGEQLLPQVATLRLSPVSTRITEPPHPARRARGTRPKLLPKPFMKSLPPDSAAGARVA
jgi:hypothetical protein